MNLKEFITNLRRPKNAAKSSQAGPMIAWSQVGQPRWTPRSYQNFADEGFRKNVIAYRCVMQIATASASVPWLLYDGQGAELDRHPLLDLLRHPNPLQDGVTFLESVYANLEIAGNAYIEAVQAGDHANDGAPVELYVLRPDRMKVVPGPAGLPQAYQYEVNGQRTIWPADPITGASHILHIKKFNPIDDWYGLAPMEAASVSIDQHNSAGAWNQALLNQGARPSGALVYAPKDGPNTLSEDQVRRLREELGTLYQGDRNAGRPLILEGGLDWREMSLSPKDMDWLAGRNAAARDIALAFGVPAQLVGVPDAQTYSNFAEARMAFYEETVIPLVTRVISNFDHWLTPLFDDSLQLDFDPDEISALSYKRDALWSKLQNANFLTLNEKREAAGYGPIESGDRVKRSRRFIYRKEDIAEENSSLSPKVLSISDDGLDFIAGYEDFRPHVYDDEAGNPTIGYGHLLGAGEVYPQGVSQEEAFNLLREDVGSAEASVRHNVDVDLTQDQFDALTSLVYNIGSGHFRDSTLLNHLNDGNYDEAAEQFLVWDKIHSNGQLVQSDGLASRRSAERDMFLGEYDDQE